MMCCNEVSWKNLIHQSSFKSSQKNHQRVNYCNEISEKATRFVIVSYWKLFNLTTKIFLYISIQKINIHILKYKDSKIIKVM